MMPATIHALRRLLKSAFLVGLLVLSAAPVAADDASVLRVLLVMDTNAGKVGGDFNGHRQANLANLARLTSVISDVHNSHLKGRIFLDVLKDNDVTPRNVYKYYRETVGRDERCHLLFIYCGHGGCDQRLGHYLCMSGGWMLRSEVYRLMADTGASGLFLLTNCCSNYGGYFGNLNPLVANDVARPAALCLADAFGTRLRLSAAAPATTWAQPAGVAPGTSPALGLSLPAEPTAAPAAEFTTDNRRANVDLFYDLFYRSEGVHNITAATEGTLSWGQYFIIALTDQLCLPVSTIRPDTAKGTLWENFFFKVRNASNSIFHANQFPNDPQARQQGSMIPQAFRLGSWPKNPRRQLVVKNNTGRTIRVHVKYYDVCLRDSTWNWHEPDTYRELVPGETTTLSDRRCITVGGGGSGENTTCAATTKIVNRQVVGGSKVRIWAESADGAVVWHEYRDKDLLLAPPDGYQGPTGRFTFTFNPMKDDTVQETARVKQDSRRVWSYPGGVVKDLGRGDWIEVRDNGSRESFQETARSKDFIDMFDARRGYTVRIGQDRWWMKGGTAEGFARYEDFVPIGEGAWNE